MPLIENVGTKHFRAASTEYASKGFTYLVSREEDANGNFIAYVVTDSKGNILTQVTDGSKADVAIQAAIDAMASNGSILLTGDTFTTTAKITLDLSNYLIQLKGNNAKIKLNGPSGQVGIEVKGLGAWHSELPTLTGLYIDGKEQYGANSDIGVSITDCSQAPYLERLWLQDLYKGIELKLGGASQSERFRLEHSEIDNCNYGFYIPDQGSSTSFMEIYWRDVAVNVPSSSLTTDKAIGFYQGTYASLVYSDIRFRAWLLEENGVGDNTGMHLDGNLNEAELVYLIEAPGGGSGTTAIEVGSNYHPSPKRVGYVAPNVATAVDNSAGADWLHNDIIVKEESGNVSFNNMLPNADFEVGDPPVGWDYSGTGASSSRSSTQVYRGSYSGALTNGADNDAYFFASPAFAADYQGKVVSFGAYVWADTANRVRLRLFDGAIETFSDYHPGDSTWKWLELCHNVDPNADRFRARLYISSGSSITAYIDQAIMTLGNFLPYWSAKPLTDSITNYGTATFSGDGTTTSFSFPHGLPDAPSHVEIGIKSADARAAAPVSWSADATDITVTFDSAPASGTGNVVFSWRAWV